MTEESRAQGCLLGLACGDALGRPVEFKSAAEIESLHGEVTEMLGNGTHGQPSGTITDDTEMALCIAESLAGRNGFVPDDVADRFVEWLDSNPFDIGLMTRDALFQIKQGRSWNEAGVDVWESRPEGSNAGNGSVMRCAPHAIAFRHFESELDLVSRLSSSITHADPRCQWGCVLLNRLLANLIRDEDKSLEAALTHTYGAPDELRNAIEQVNDVLNGDRNGANFENQISTTGYVVDSLQAGLYYGLSADSVEDAIVQAVNHGGDTDTVGAITGAVAGARFGIGDIPTRWSEEISEAKKLTRLATRLLSIRTKVPGKRYATLDDGSLIFKQRTVEGPTYISVKEFQEATIGHRPHPAPHRTLGIDYHDLTPATAAMLDWERRAYAVQSRRTEEYAAPEANLDSNMEYSYPKLVQVPQYPFVDSFEELPELDQRRIKRDGREAMKSFLRAYESFVSIRHPIIEADTQSIGIEGMDPITGATRVSLSTFGELSEHLLGTDVCDGCDSPNKIERKLETNVGEGSVASHPQSVIEATKVLPKVQSDAGAILDHLTNLRISPEQQRPHQTVLGDEEREEKLAEVREHARTMVGELHVVYESLRRVAVRHPDIDYEPWQRLTDQPVGVE